MKNDKNQPADPRNGRGQPSTAAALSAALERAKELLASGTEPQSSLIARLSGLIERLSRQRLQIAVLGQFKRGKSTFLNALLGAPLLPSSVVPVTAIPTFIAWGETPSARISFHDQRAPEECATKDVMSIQAFLHRFVAEEANPQNRLGVARAELFYPAPILSGNTLFIDTPGVGSTLKHNTDAALRALPECDAAFFVVGTDPPVTQIEIDYLEQVRSKASRVFLVVNKVDTLVADERAALERFLRGILRERSLLPDDSMIYQISARQGLAAKQIGDCTGLEQSGIKDIEDRLLRFLALEKSDSLEHAIALKSVDLLGQATSQIELRVQASRMPLLELDDKTMAFRSLLHDIGEQRRVTSDLMTGDKSRLVDMLEERIAGLRHNARKQVAAAMDRSLAGTNASGWEGAVERDLPAAIEEIFETACVHLTSEVSAESDKVLSAYRGRVDELVAAVKRTAADLFDVSFENDADTESFALGEDPYWITRDPLVTLIPSPGRLIDRLLPSDLRRRRLRKRLMQGAERLIVRNAENLRWAIFRGFDETFRRAIADLEERWNDALDATSTVIETALKTRREKGSASDPEVACLVGVLDALNALRESIHRAIPKGKGSISKARPTHQASAARGAGGDRTRTDGQVTKGRIG